MTNNTKPRKDKNINFWVAEKSEKMLVQDRVPSSDGRKEHSFKITISEKHRNRPREDRKRQEK